MKRLSTVPVFFCAVLIFLLGIRHAEAGVIRNWTNSLGGNWFESLSWSPNGVPGNGDAAVITNIGTYTVIVSTGVVATATITIGGASGKQTLIYGSTAAFTKLGLTNSFVQANGVLLVTNAGMFGSVTIKSGGEMQLDSPGMQLYSFAITNEGTLTWSNGALAIGGNNSEITYLTNTGLFQITGDANMNYGGGGRSTLYNAGIIRKLNGTGTSIISGIDLINLPSGTVDVLSGTLQVSGIATNELGGTFTATTPGVLKFGGKDTDVGGIASGSGQIQFFSGTFYLRTNTIPNLKFTGGDVYISGTNSFQQAGAITNLTLDGANLRGTNRIAGTVTVNGGNLVDEVTVLPTGQLFLAATGGASSQLYYCHLFNQGTVNWSGNNLAVGGVPSCIISNGGTWTITGDAAMSYGFSGTAVFTNTGILQKTGGTGITSFDNFPFVNMPSGIIRVASGTLRMPSGYTNQAGEIQLAGGTLADGFPSGIGMVGGVLDGSGTVGVAAVFDGGTVAPGPSAGSMRFTSSLTLGTNCILALDGTGTVPGVSYDQLSVTGAVAISNCTLQVSSLPSVPVGTTFVIITNTTANPTAGTFNGLPENALITISGRPFRIHYSGGDGNDVVLVRDSGGVVTGPQLSGSGYTNKTFKLLGAGNGSTIFTIQASTNLVQWTNVGNATGDISGNFIFTDTNAANFIRRFYRTTN
jgi:fibronectin-binding autotransporter adhesin